MFPDKSIDKVTFIHDGWSYKCARLNDSPYSLTLVGDDIVFSRMLESSSDWSPSVRIATKPTDETWDQFKARISDHPEAAPILELAAAIGA